MKEKIAKLESAIKDILPPTEQNDDEDSAQQQHNQFIITGGLNLINIGTRKQKVKVNNAEERDEVKQF